MFHRKISVKEKQEKTTLILYIQLWIHFGAYSSQKHTPDPRVTVNIYISQYPFWYYSKKQCALKEKSAINKDKDDIK